MKRTRSRGMILTWVILILGLAAAAMMLLTDGATTLLYQADTAYGQAVERNLTASALAWAQEQVAKDTPPAIGEPITLDSTQVGGELTHLTVEFTRLDDSSADVVVQTSFVKGRHRLEQSRKYAISAP